MDVNFKEVYGEVKKLSGLDLLLNDRYKNHLWWKYSTVPPDKPKLAFSLNIVFHVCEKQHPILEFPLNEEAEIAIVEAILKDDSFAVLNMKNPDENISKLCLFKTKNFSGVSIPLKLASSQDHLSEMFKNHDWFKDLHGFSDLLTKAIGTPIPAIPGSWSAPNTGNPPQIDGSSFTNGKITY